MVGIRVSPQPRPFSQFWEKGGSKWFCWAFRKCLLISPQPRPPLPILEGGDALRELVGVVVNAIGDG